MQILIYGGAVAGGIVIGVLLENRYQARRAKALLQVYRNEVANLLSNYIIGPHVVAPIGIIEQVRNG